VISNTLTVNGTIAGNASGLTNGSSLIDNSTITLNVLGKMQAAGSGNPAAAVTNNVATQIFSGQQNMTNSNNQFSGTFSGNLIGNKPASSVILAFDSNSNLFFSVSNNAAVVGTNSTAQTYIDERGNGTNTGTWSAGAMTLNGVSLSNSIIGMAGAAIAGSNYETQAAIILSNYVYNSYGTPWTNSNGNVKLGTLGGNVGELWLADSVNSAWDTLLGSAGSPQWNGLVLLTNNQTGVTLQGAFSGNGGGLTNIQSAKNVNGYPYSNSISMYDNNSNLWMTASNGVLTVGSNTAAQATITESGVFNGNASGATNLAGSVPAGATTNLLANIGGSGATVSFRGLGYLLVVEAVAMCIQTPLSLVFSHH
jgi:hypothetical protein